MRVRSVIGRPVAGERVGRSLLEIGGTAWSGEGGIVRVEVSADGGSTWGDARLDHAASPWAATPWRFDWTPPRAGPFTLMARATDDAGNTQPISPRQNALGYGNNGAHSVAIDVHD